MRALPSFLALMVPVPYSSEVPWSVTSYLPSTINELFSEMDDLPFKSNTAFDG